VPRVHGVILQAPSEDNGSCSLHGGLDAWIDGRRGVDRLARDVALDDLDDEHGPERVTLQAAQVKHDVAEIERAVCGIDGDA
jgi:hypothetical protein